MIKPIRIRHSEILARAYAALGADQQAELRKAHYARVRQRAREIIERAEAQRRLAAQARLAAHKALLSVADAFTKICDSTTSTVDQERWRESRKLVERELQKILGTRRRR
jgi:hypothetical protein